MRIEMPAAAGPEHEPDWQRGVGAVVARQTPTGGVAVEFGPADGRPFLRLLLTAQEATKLTGTVEAILSGRGEQVMLVEE